MSSVWIVGLALAARVGHDGPVGGQERAHLDAVGHEDAQLVQWAGDRDPSVRASAVAGLRRRVRRAGVQSVPGQLTDALVTAARDPVGRVRVRAVSALAHLPVEVGFPVAAAALEDDEHAVREAAGRAVIAMAPERAGVRLAELCQDTARSSHARAAALTAMRMLPVIESVVRSALIACLGERDEVVRSAALSSARALAIRPGHWHPWVCQTALEGIDSPNPYRREISLALARQVNAPGYQDRCRELRGDRNQMVSARAQRELTLQPYSLWRTDPSKIGGY